MAGPDATTSQDAILRLDKTPGTDQGVPKFFGKISNGTQLLARYITTAEGFQIFRGWYDSSRKEDCTFSQAIGGTWRCLPLPAARKYVSSLKYLDAACTKPTMILDFPTPSSVPAYYVEVLSGSYSCSLREFRKVGSAPQFGSKAYAKDTTTGLCTISTVPANTSSYRELLPVVETDFIAATEQQDSNSASRLQPFFLLAKDGAVQQYPSGEYRSKYYDTKNGSICRLDYGESKDQYRCLPDQAATITGQDFGDAACTKLAGYQPACNVLPPNYAMQKIPASGCDSSATSKLFTTSGKITAAYQSTSSCQSMASTGLSYYLLENELDITTWAPFSLETPGAGRLWPRRWTADGGIQAFDSSFEDSQLQGLCQFRKTADGLTRCIPVRSSAIAAYYEPRFIDAQCTVFGLFVLPKENCPLTLPAYVTQDSGDQVEVFTVGAEAQAGKWYYLYNGTCFANPNSPSSNEHLYHLTKLSAAQLSVFAEGTNTM
jgi:hypothetical protein